jgi:hypothetical protein
MDVSTIANSLGKGGGRQVDVTAPQPAQFGGGMEMERRPQMGMLNTQVPNTGQPEQPGLLGGQANARNGQMASQAVRQAQAAMEAAMQGKPATYTPPQGGGTAVRGVASMGGGGASGSAYDLAEKAGLRGSELDKVRQILGLLGG